MSIDLPENFTSQKTRDASRLAIQSAVAAAITFTLMKWWEMPERFVGVLSAVLIVKSTVGSTLVSGFERFMATLVGCAIGTLCIAFIPTGYGTAASLAIAMLVMNGIAGFRSEWRYGVVAAVALALGSEDGLWEMARDRSLGILMGVVVGIGTSLCVWPEKASTRANRHMRASLLAIGDYLSLSIEGLQTSDSKAINEARNRYTSEISAARSAASAVNIADSTQLTETISLIERLESSVNILNRVAGSTENLSHGDDDREHSLKTFRNVGGEITKALGKGNAPDAKSKLEEFKTRITKFREKSGSESHEPEDQLRLRALQFGLEDTHQSLSSLAEALLDHGDTLGSK